MKWFRSIAIAVSIVVANDVGVSLAGDPARGVRIARSNCAPCHAIGRTGVSPNPISPPFRTLRAGCFLMESGFPNRVLSDSRFMLEGGRHE